MEVLRQREAKWLEMLNSWDKWMAKKHKKVCLFNCRTNVGLQQLEPAVFRMISMLCACRRHHLGDVSSHARVEIIFCTLWKYLQFFFLGVIPDYHCHRVCPS